MGTLWGNLVNASPIVDLSIFFLALDAEIQLTVGEGKKRKLPLKDFFLDYKKLDLRNGELIESLRFRLPDKGEFFNFEKVSKRQHLDIASVNTAIRLRIENETIIEATVSAGGIGPLPTYLSKTSTFLSGQKLNEEILFKANEVLQNEISPISDIRGSEAYKRLLLRQLFFAHFITLKPELFSKLLEV
jgi:xanthine dehydrogenase small subunit